MNICFLIGNITREPELIQGTQKPLCRMNIAVNENYTDKDGNRPVHFFNIVAWGKLGETCSKFVHKGSKIAVVGKMQTRSWVDEKGDTKYATEVVCTEVEFISTKKKDENKEEKKEEFEPIDDPDGQLPF